MKENVADRVARIVSGGAHQLLDVLELSGPESAMEQAVREVEEAIRDLRGECGRVIAEKHLLNRRLMKENSLHETLSDQLNLALNQGRKDLAQEVVRRQLEIESRIPEMEAQIGEAVHRERELKAAIQSLNQRIDVMRGEWSEKAKADEAADRRPLDGEDCLVSSRVRDKIDRAERVFARAISPEGRMHSETGYGSALLAELEELARQQRIDERLKDILRERGGSDD